jgi:hypothetical protein
MARQDVSLGDDDVESSTESIIREPALSPDQVRALSLPARGGTPTGPVSIESMVKPVQQQQRSESPLVECERTKSPEAQNYGQQQPNLASANGITVRNMKAGSASSITTDLIRDVKAHDVELETLRHHEAWMRAALAQALHAGLSTSTPALVMKTAVLRRTHPGTQPSPSNVAARG